MFDQLVTPKAKEGTLIFVKDETVIMLIDNSYSTMPKVLSGIEAYEEFLSYGIELYWLDETQQIRVNSNGIRVYFLEA